MKSDGSTADDYLELVEAIYTDASAKCSANVFDLRDLITIRSRVKNEGLSFLTITLPAFARGLERSLALGRIDSESFAGFQKLGRGRTIPSLFRGMLSQLFDFDTGGLIYHDPQDGGSSCSNSVVIEAIRQTCLSFKKMEIPCTPAREQAALKNFEKVEQSFDTFEPTDEDISRFREVSSVLWHNLVASYNYVDHETVAPKHGPGGVAEKLTPNEKFAWSRWHERLEQYFPFLGNAAPLGLATEQEFEKLTFVSPSDEQPVRVVTVPKTLKGPRIIAIEPACMQFVQQGIRDWLYRTIEQFPLTRGHVNFRDQEVNRYIALMSSSTGLMATIDLSDASDRVPLSLVKYMFEGSDLLWQTILACRSDGAEMPDGTVIRPLRKFASMGSALCFPIEAMYFYTCCVAALLKERGLSCTFANIHMVSRDVYVYGDDISVPAREAEVVLACLQRYNCKVNAAKSFWTGRFRESCGMDAYGGYDVTPTYVTQRVPEDRQDAKQLIAWVMAGRSFYKRGYWRTAQLMWSTCERYLGELPYTSDESSALGRYSYLGYQTATRWNVNMHKFEVRAWAPREVRRTDELRGYAALTKSLLASDGPLWSFHRTRGRVLVCPSPPPDVARLAKSVRRGAVTLKRLWADVH